VRRHRHLMSVAGSMLVVMMAAAAPAIAARPTGTARFVWGRGTRLPVTAIPRVAHGSDAPRLACAGPRLCIAVDQAGGILATSTPTRRHAAWKLVAQLSHVIDVACPSARLCVVVSGGGGIMRSFAPARPGSWRTVSQGQTATAGPYANPAVMLSALACPSTSFCVAVGGTDVVAIRRPDSARPQVETTTVEPAVEGACGEEHEPCQTPLLDVACPTSHQCVALDDLGGIYTSRDPAIPATWKLARTDSPVSGGLACPSAQLCFAAGAATSVVASTGLFAFDPVTDHGLGFAWHRDVDDIFCPLTGDCFAVDLDAPLASISEPAAVPLPLSGWRTQDLTPPRAETDNGVASIACPTTEICLATDDHADVYRGTRSAA
jgi:hypothetical protein